ncbi:MAG: hypothetical protein K0S04_898 [Herbinix sp.]|jgi:hypothetical protein|nr:hypothetical protein [Herbinix sp.]
MKKTWMWISKLLVAIAIIVTIGIILPKSEAYAATTIDPIEIVSVEYYEEQIIVQNNNNTKICFATESDAARGNWEVIDTDTADYTTIDMSWLSSTTENIIMVKGYEDATATTSRVVLKRKPTKLEISINYEKLDSLDSDTSIGSLVNIMTTEGTGDDPIDFTDLEWRKGETGQWKNTDSLTAGLIDKFLVKGTTLYFRIRAKDDVVNISTDPSVDFEKLRTQGNGGLLSYLSLPANSTATLGSDFPDGTEGRRFSNEVKVKVAKKSVASGYGIDGSRFTANIKYGNEYRVTVGSDTSEWVKIIDRTVKSTQLSTMVKSAVSSSDDDGTTEAKAFPAMKIEVRDYATSKSASSKITETSINKQRTIDEDALFNGEAPASVPSTNTNIYISYNGNKNMILEIPSASSAQPYEYTVTKPNETLNLAKATWTSVTKGTEVKILATKAVEGGTLFIRMKEIKAKNATSTSNAVNFELASTYVSANISYPSVPEIVDATYTFTKGYSDDISFAVTLNAKNKTPFEEKIKTIKLGTKEIEFEQNTSTDSDGVKTIAVKLKSESLETLANCYVKAITITYENGTIDKTSIKLTIQSPAAASVLTVTHTKASTGGTAFSIITNKGVGNSWVYVKTTTAVTDVSIQDTVKTKTGIDLLPENNIPTATMDNVPITTGQYLTIFEVNSSGYIVKYKSIQITADYIR